MLGYHMLFQDVDIIWNKDPVSLFLDKSESYSNYDMLFMDDGKIHSVTARIISPFQPYNGLYLFQEFDI